MPVMEPAVVLLSHDEDRNLHDDKQLESVVIISDDDEVNIDGVEGLELVVVISDDDGDEENNLNEEELKLEPDGKYSELNNHKDVEKSKVSDERVDCVHEGSNELQELSLYECKSYLRKHGMRVSGTKEECIQRIKEHERLKDGKAESLYPVSSFSINCTGDACKGDIVLFKQEIKEGVNIVGKRTVVGRILKESYGASSQHTFSVEVLWSRGSKKLNPLSLLLSKGRNFYKFGTLRQPWENEAERSKVLKEKHSRGDAARQKWKLRQTRFASNTNKGAKRQKVSHNGPSQSNCPTQMDKQKPAKRRGAATVKESTTTHKRKGVLVAFRKMKFKRSTKLIFRPVLNSKLSPNPNRKWKKNRNLNPNLDSYIYPDHHQQEASSSFPYDRTLVSFGYHRNQQWGPNNVFNQRPAYCHHNYDRPLTRLKSVYPRSSFSIDCTDNACKGDVVLFKCNIYKRGKIVRKKRTIVGRIVEKSYGASNKQHIFMVEVLWTKPTTIKLSPISTLQVKDWKLYKFGTFRQPWKNEAKRSKLLIKKHRRVLAASHKRKLRKTDIASNNNQGAKRQKVSPRGSCQSKQPSQIDKQKYAKRGSAAHVKDCTTTQKMKRWSQRKELKRSRQKTFHPDPYQIPDPNLNANLNPKPNLKPKANPAPKPNSNRDINPNPNPNQSKRPSKLNKQKYAKRQGLLHVKECTSIHKRVQKKKLKTQPNLIPKSNLKPKANPDPNPNSNRKTNPRPNLKPKANLNPNSNSNRETNPNPNPNCYVYSDDHLQEASSSFSYHRTPLPNQLPIGFSPNQPPLGFSPNQPPLGFSPNKPPLMFSPNQPSLRFLPNQPPFGFPPNQQPFGFPPNQHPFGFPPNQQPFTFPPNQQPFTFPPNQHPFTFPSNQPQGPQPVLSGYGGQWRPNYAFYQPLRYSDYNMLTVPSPIISAAATPRYLQPNYGCINIEDDMIHL